MAASDVSIADTLDRHRDEIIASWVSELAGSQIPGSGPLDGASLDRESAELVDALRYSFRTGTSGDPYSSEWNGARDVLDSMTGVLARQGYAPVEVASVVFALKRPVVEALGRDLSRDPSSLADATWRVSLALDQLGLYTTEVAQRARDSVIARQQQEILELSTPVVQLWEGILALPLIGTLDSARTQVVMESLLDQIVATGSDTAIVDITGVPAVDTAVAQHLLKTVAAARLMGADCIISGIRPQIAQTIVHLGVDLGDIATKASLAEAFRLALERTGKRIVTA